MLGARRFTRAKWEVSIQMVLSRESLREVAAGTAASTSELALGMGLMACLVCHRLIKRAFANAVGVRFPFGLPAPFGIRPLELRSNHPPASHSSMCPAGQSPDECFIAVSSMPSFAKVGTKSPMPHSSNFEELMGVCEHAGGVVRIEIRIAPLALVARRVEDKAEVARVQMKTFDELDDASLKMAEEIRRNLRPR